MSTGSGKKSTESRNRILDTALALFRERGFEQTTMRQIAEGAQMALGAAYYHFASKDDLVMAFYVRAQERMLPRMEEALEGASDFEGGLRALLTVKYDGFAEDRGLLGALSGHINPGSALSPFSEQTREIRERDIEYFSRALSLGKTRVPPDLKRYLPRLLWLYQMGLILYWIYDSSPGQYRTSVLVDRSVKVVAKLIGLAGFPLLRPIRRSVVELLEVVYGEV